MASIVLFPCFPNRWSLNFPSLLRSDSTASSELLQRKRKKMKKSRRRRGRRSKEEYIYSCAQLTALTLRHHQAPCCFPTSLILILYVPSLPKKAHIMGVGRHNHHSLPVSLMLYLVCFITSNTKQSVKRHSGDTVPG